MIPNNGYDITQKALFVLLPVFDCGFSPAPSLLLRRFSVLVEPLADRLFLNYNRARERRGEEREEEREWKREERERRRGGGGE